MRKPPPKQSRARPVETAHWAVKQLDLLCRAEDISREELGRRAGVSHDTMYCWWAGTHNPGIILLEACFQVFDLEFKLSGKKES